MRLGQPLQSARLTSPKVIVSRVRWVRHYWATGCLIAILLCSALLSLRWVFLVPIYQSADETSHLDYAFTIFSAGRLISAHERSGVYKVYVHPYTLYLINRTGFNYVALKPTVKMAPNYGTLAYYRDLARDAPAAQSVGQPHYNPGLLTLYPFGYYAVLAIWLGILSRFSQNLVFLFFGARIFSVVLLTGTLGLFYATARKLPVAGWLALLLTACIGSFPMVSYVSSYVQPDNLSFFLVALSLYLSLLLRSKPDRPGLLTALGITLGVLLVTKIQHYLCVIVPVGGMLAATLWNMRANKGAWVRFIAALLLPTLIFESLQIWVNWGASPPVRDVPISGFPYYSAIKMAWAGGSIPFIGYILHSLVAAFTDFYVSGQTFASYWGLFGWVDTPLTTGSAGADRVIGLIIRLLTVTTFVLAVTRLFRITWRLHWLVQQGRGKLAIRITLFNPVLNSYFLFTLFMFFFFILTNNTFFAQGRNWIPYILATLLVAVSYAPKGLPWKRLQAALSLSMLGCFLVYCFLGSYLSLQVIQARFYGTVVPLNFSALNRLTGETQQFIDTINEHKVPEAPITIEQGTAISLKGWAVDSSAHASASGVFISLDGRFHYQALYGDERVDVGQALHNSGYNKSGFQLILPTAELSPGTHKLTIQVVTKDRKAYYDSSQTIHLEITP